jgi:CheY-like chemotaxis protein
VSFLRRLNIPTDVAANGEIAVNLYREHPNRYGAILMDICMPVMDGLVASREIRSFELIASGRSPRLNSASIALGASVDAAVGLPVARFINPRKSLSGSGNVHRIPIVALSAQVMDQDRDACMLAGMDGFLEKPVRYENLRKLLEPIYAQYPKWQNPNP